MAGERPVSFHEFEGGQRFIIGSNEYIKLDRAYRLRNGQEVRVMHVATGQICPLPEGHVQIVGELHKPPQIHYQHPLSDRTSMDGWGPSVTDKKPAKRKSRRKKVA